MNNETKIRQCFNCGKDENEIPLIQLVYSGTPTWICPQCLPVLIHHVEQLTEKMKELSGK